MQIQFDVLYLLMMVAVDILSKYEVNELDSLHNARFLLSRYLEELKENKIAFLSLFSLLQFQLFREATKKYSDLIKVHIKLYVVLKFNYILNSFIDENLQTLTYLHHKIQSEFSLLNSAFNNYLNKLKNTELYEKS